MELEINMSFSYALTVLMTQDEGKKSCYSKALIVAYAVDSYIERMNWAVIPPELMENLYAMFNMEFDEFVAYETGARMAHPISFLEKDSYCFFWRYCAFNAARATDEFIAFGFRELAKQYSANYKVESSIEKINLSLLSGKMH